jgi:hypothetical protein
VSVQRAFDEARFGPERTLNLRAQMPTAQHAVAWAEAWLRERQVAKAGEVLVITGRGKGSEGGVSVVREAIAKLLASLRRQNVVAEFREHTPGSFAVRLASVRALYERPRPGREPEPRAGADPGPPPGALAGLTPRTRALLRELACQSIDALGVNTAGQSREAAEALVRDEMLRQFATLSAAAGAGDDREPRLQAAIERALRSYEDL